MQEPKNALAGARWRKSTRSGGAQQCVELASLPSGGAVRDSKNTEGLVLLFSGDAFEAFLTDARAGRIDLH